MTMTTERKMEAAAKDFSSTYECMGLTVGERKGDNVKCDCPFCGKVGHFFLNVQTGLFDCKVCLKAGNVFDFLGEVVDQMEGSTAPEQFEELAQRRGYPAEAFKEWGVGFNSLTQEWVVPMYSDKGVVKDVRRLVGKRFMTTDGCKAQLGGLYLLATSKEARKRRVWICEGEWDAFGLRWLLKQCGSLDLVVWVPGAGIFKNEWIPWFKDTNVVWGYDNDETGDEGSKKGSIKLTGIAKRQQFVGWPETRPVGWDINNHIKEGLEKRLEPRIILAELEALIDEKHRRDATGDATRQQATPREDIGPPASYNEVLTVFKKWVKMDRDFMDCLMISLAVPLANLLPGEPLWFYLIGVPSSGKTLILSSLSTSDKCSFHSTLTPKSLVSGFNVNPDPSLLPRINGLTAVFKDGTELLSMHPDARREIYSTFRGAFDGRVDRPYGNGVNRVYSDLHFNMLIGITPAVRGDSEATKGERFLNVELREAAGTAALYQCLKNSMHEKEMNLELSEVCARFLNREINPDNLPKIPEPFIHRIVAMAQLIALLRAQVDRDPRDRDLRYRAAPESAKRALKQLIKLSRVLAVVLGKVEVDADVSRLLRKVMADTCVGFHVDIVKSLIRNKNKSMTPGELAQTSRMTAMTLSKRLEDMAVLNILQTFKGSDERGSTVSRYALSDRVMELWAQAEDGVPRGD